ncbi:MAG: dicarboxylate/amino acid:cation symporter [Fusobacterium varium]|jgi:Na+/H+-dicarboxylate symporter|uniref:dicarboxylate/amino acid:cation symporter n=6 Tax=Fusobacterium varium TaxID=856 RepID=UPI0024329F5D|nr:dicarboxylate/amino acid:cation symporter [Fusobacterium varium]MCI6032490.1 dicarboxylate/amino acid:cation symporter [Fusobacterium varium]MDY4007012.1 dicarboxylate/amino acid:cation symporter [Fusobacterium varium]
MKKLGLLPKLIIGLIAGIIIGKIGFVPLLRIMLTFNGLFGNFLQFVIPLIILGFVAPGIGDLGKKAGKLLAVTTVLAYGSTIVSGSLAFFTNSILLKKILPAGAALAEGSHPEAGLLSGYLTVDMPPIMGVMTALLMAFIIGIGIAVVEGTTLKNFMNEIQTIVEKIITNIIIPFLPLYIAGIFANMTYAGEIIKIMSVFAKVFGIIIILHFVILLVQYTIAGTLAGANPLLLIRKMLPAYFTAIGTQSSAATIPVTLNQTKENGVNEGIADFTIPLCATIHLSGSTITLVSCSMAVMMLHGMPITFSGMFGFILMLGVTMVAAPGVPGGAVMAALGLLESMLGFGPELTSLMIALYLTQDSFGTACNVTGDGAIAIMVNKIAGFKLTPLKKENRIKVS